MRSSVTAPSASDASKVPSGASDAVLVVLEVAFDADLAGFWAFPADFSDFSAKSSSITCSEDLLSWSISGVGTMGRDWRVLATGIRVAIASLITAGSPVTITATFSQSLAVRAISFMLTTLRRMVAFFGGTSATSFCSARWSLVRTSVMSSSGSK